MICRHYRDTHDYKSHYQIKRNQAWFDPFSPLQGAYIAHKGTPHMSDNTRITFIASIPDPRKRFTLGASRMEEQTTFGGPIQESGDSEHKNPDWTSTR